MKTMIVGGGGREHALAMAEHEAGSELVFPQANAGMEELGTNLQLRSNEEIVEAAWGLNVELAIIGPEQPLIHGLADALRAEDVLTIGASRAMARLEASKSFATHFMETYDIPHPATVVTDDLGEAISYARSRKARDYVIKADGVAAGKGVKLPQNRAEAEQVIAAMMSGELFGESGRIVNLQDRLHGQEISMIALLDGEKAQVLGLAQDYKRLENDDKGPNTGGMGSYMPVPPEIADERQVQLMYEAMGRTVEGLNREGMNSPAFLYMGFMLAEEFDGDPVVLEYNVRSGDPETQVIMPSLREAGINVHELLVAAARGGLEGDTIIAAPQLGQFALAVCLAVKGYPNDPRLGDPIYSFNGYPGLEVYHGGTERRKDDGGQTFTAGGRVLYPTGLGDTPAETAKKVYSAIGDEVSFGGMQYRTDIGHQAIKAVKRGNRK